MGEIKGVLNLEHAEKGRRKAEQREEMDKAASRKRQKETAMASQRQWQVDRGQKLRTSMGGASNLEIAGS